MGAVCARVRSPGTGGNPATLINPNPYLDVPGITALRDTMFSGDWFEFKITSPQQGAQLAGGSNPEAAGSGDGGHLDRPAHPEAHEEPGQPDARAGVFTQNNIVGIPAVSLAPVINALAFRVDVDNTTTNTSARTYNSTVAMLQQASYNLFRYLYNHQVEATGLRMARGISLRAFLLGDQLFRRYGFATPVYQIVTQLGALQPELKDWVSLTHPLVPDYIGGGRGVTNIPCEIIGRSPDYANGQVRFTLLDMRRASTTSPYEIVPSASMVLPPYVASHRERAGDVFLYHALHEWCVYGGAEHDFLIAGVRCQVSGVRKEGVGFKCQRKSQLRGLSTRVFPWHMTPGT